jgi:tetratricopeptide (TPR) repeat protein
MLNPSQTETLQQIAATARAGRLDAAAMMVEQARIAGQMNPTLAALGGAIEFHRGQFARAIPDLTDAQTYHPTDMTIRANLAEAHFHCGDNKAALALCDDASVATDPSLRLARLGGHLAQEVEDYARAIACYRRVTAAHHDDWSIWNNLGNALSATGEYAEAAEALEKAAKLAPDSAPIKLNLGNTLLQAGRVDDAERQLREIAVSFPDDPNPLMSLFTLFTETGREDEAYEAVREAAKRAPDSASIQSDFGQEAARRNDYAVAEPAFERALAIDPVLGPAFVGLASVYERMNREAELDPLHDRAIKAAIDPQSIHYIEALRHKRRSDIDAAFAALELSGDVVVAGRKHHLRGTMLDRLGRHDEAFAEFQAMNEHWMADPSQPVERAKMYREMVARDNAILTSEWFASWGPDTQPSPWPSPIFLLGFPRSGTTLLDTMLMADPDVRVLEEEPFIGQVEESLGRTAALASLTPAQLHEARLAYFAKVEASVGPLEGVQIVDKHPLHLNKVPVIRRLFPDAKFVLALRHPCDVLLSCYLTNFRINNAMANFLRLEDAAALYDLSFSNWERAREIFDLPVGTVVYEQLVEDKNRELRPLFDWLGLTWPGEEFDHRDAARARGTVATASYAQVTEPIYKRAAGRWVRYREQLEPVLPTLDKWIKRYGYEV